MSEDARKLLALFVTTLAVGAALALVLPRLLGAQSPEVELISKLKEREADGFTHDLGQLGQLRSKKLSYQRISVEVGPSKKDAAMTCTLDFVGELGKTTVSSLGAERLEWVDDFGWRPVDGWAPRLTRAVRFLEQRRRTLERGEVVEGADDEEMRLSQMSKRSFGVEAWYLRFEPEGAQVSEAQRLKGDLPDRPVDLRRTRRLRLVEENNQFVQALSTDE